MRGRTRAPVVELELNNSNGVLGQLAQTTRLLANAGVDSLEAPKASTRFSTSAIASGTAPYMRGARLRHRARRWRWRISSRRGADGLWQVGAASSSSLVEPDYGQVIGSRGQPLAHEKNRAIAESRSACWLLRASRLSTPALGEQPRGLGELTEDTIGVIQFEFDDWRARPSRM